MFKYRAIRTDNREFIYGNYSKDLEDKHFIEFESGTHLYTTEVIKDSVSIFFRQKR